MPIQGRPFTSCVCTCTRDSELRVDCYRAERDWHHIGGAGKRGVRLAERPILLLCGASTVSPIVFISSPLPSERGRASLNKPWLANSIRSTAGCSSHLLTPNQRDHKVFSTCPEPKETAGPWSRFEKGSLRVDFQTPLVAPPLSRQLLCPSLTRYVRTISVISLFTLTHVPSLVSLVASPPNHRQVPSRPLSRDFTHIGIYRLCTSLSIRDGTSLFHGSWHASDVQPASPTTSQSQSQFRGARVHLSVYWALKDSCPLTEYS